MAKTESNDKESVRQEVDLIKEDAIRNKIYMVRGQKVMLDTDLQKYMDTRQRHLIKKLKEILRDFQKILCSS